MKILFITHCHGNYGASRSLSLLTRNLSGHEVTLVIGKSPMKLLNHTEIATFYGVPEDKIHEFYLPFEYCYLGRPEETLLKLKNKVKNSLWLKDRNKLLKLFSDNELVYLNSTVLYPLISICSKPIISHIREMVIDDKAVNALKNSDGLIFIDKATSQPFEDSIDKKGIIINNPFDMTSLKKMDIKHLREKHDIPADTIIFSCIGRINKVKGIDLIIKAFLKCKDKNAILLIVGAGDAGSGCENECRELAIEDKRVRFLGEIDNIGEIYRITDCLLRGESEHLIGRTIFEALYAGCRVIIPGDDDNLNDNPCLKEFKDKITFYPPKNIAALTNAIEGAEKVSENRVLKSNVEEYISSFNSFLEEIVKHSRAGVTVVT